MNHIKLLLLLAVTSLSYVSFSQSNWGVMASTEMGPSSEYQKEGTQTALFAKSIGLAYRHKITERSSFSGNMMYTEIKHNNPWLAGWCGTGPLPVGKLKTGNLELQTLYRFDFPNKNGIQYFVGLGLSHKILLFRQAKDVFYVDDLAGEFDSYPGNTFYVGGMVSTGIILPIFDDHLMEIAPQMQYDFTRVGAYPRDIAYGLSICLY